MYILLLSKQTLTLSCNNGNILQSAPCSVSGQWPLLKQLKLQFRSCGNVKWKTCVKFQILFTNLDSAFPHGSRNLYGNSICIHHEECPTPNGTFWFNGSANHILYEECFDSKPLCFRNRFADHFLFNCLFCGNCVINYFFLESFWKWTNVVF